MSWTEKTVRSQASILAGQFYGLIDETVEGDEEVVIIDSQPLTVPWTITDCSGVAAASSKRESPLIHIIRYIDGVEYVRVPVFFGIGYRWKRNPGPDCECCKDEDDW